MAAVQPEGPDPMITISLFTFGNSIGLVFDDDDDVVVVFDCWMEVVGVVVVVDESTSTDVLDESVLKKRLVKDRNMDEDIILMLISTRKRTIRT